MAWAQERVDGRTDQPNSRKAAPTAVAAAGTGAVAARAADGEDVITLGTARFDGQTGVLISVGGLELEGPRLELWRAPIDNDRPLVGAWRRAGLDRLHHKILGVEPGSGGLSVRARVGAAGTGTGMELMYQWRAEANLVWLTAAVTPRGTWDVPLPRLGVAFTLAGEDAELEWFGLGGGPTSEPNRTLRRFG